MVLEPEVTHGTADAFGQAGRKLATLLNLPDTRHTLLVGEDLESWREGVRESFGECHQARSLEDAGLSSYACRHPYDLVVWSPGPACRAAELAAGLARIRERLGEGGALLLRVENRLGLRSAWRRPASLLSSRSLIAPQYRSRLGRAGFTRIHEYLPLPGLRETEEFVDASLGTVALPSHAHPLERGLNRAGLLPLVHEGYFYLASGPRGGTWSTLQAIGRHLPADEGSCPTTPEIERFDLRDRGALVLLLRDPGSGRRFVCRITTSPEVDRVVGRNADWTCRIHSMPRIAARIKRRIPAPLGRFSLGDATAYLEEMVPGSVGWKLAGRPHLEPSLFAGTYRFARDLSEGTAVEASLQGPALESLLAREAHAWVDGETSALLEALHAVLRERTHGTRRRLVWSHGDYGYGNVIADPRTGSLLGVIDWDQAREDLAGIDLLHFLVQRARGMRALSLPAALRVVGEPLLDGGFRGIDPRLDYEDWHPLTPALRRELLGWLTLRIVQRMLKYPLDYSRSRAEALAALAWACRVVQAA